jgi:hypothetical protein
VANPVAYAGETTKAVTARAKPIFKIGFMSFLLIDDALQIARFSPDGWLGPKNGNPLAG